MYGLCGNKIYIYDVYCCVGLWAAINIITQRGHVRWPWPGQARPPQNHDIFYLQLLFRPSRSCRVPCATATNQIQQLMVDVYFSENIPWVWTWVLISMRSNWVGDRHRLLTSVMVWFAFPTNRKAEPVVHSHSPTAWKSLSDALIYLPSRKNMLRSTGSVGNCGFVTSRPRIPRRIRGSSRLRSFRFGICITKSWPTKYYCVEVQAAITAQSSRSQPITQRARSNNTLGGLIQGPMRFSCCFAFGVVEGVEAQCMYVIHEWTKKLPAAEFSSSSLCIIIIIIIRNHNMVQ